jgi:hypothetical protein
MLPAVGAWIGLTFACNYASVEGDIEGPRARQPERKPDAGVEAEASTQEPEPVDAAVEAKAPSVTCLASDLVLCLRFEGNTTDESPVPIAPALVTGIEFVPGREDRGAMFGATSALRYAPSSAFELPAGSATIEAWIKRETTGADAVVFDADERFSLTISAAGNVLCKSSGGAVTGTSVVPVGEWVHVACVLEGTTMTAYLGGIADGSGMGAIGSSPNAGAAVGGNSPDGEPFSGVIDSFRLFRVARSAAQIAADAK